MTTTMSRTKPNIIITGTPGVGKTSLSELLTSCTELKHLAINRIAKERDCHDGWDETLKSWIVDEDKVSHREKIPPAMLIPWGLMNALAA